MLESKFSRSILQGASALALIIASLCANASADKPGEGVKVTPIFPSIAEERFRGEVAMEGLRELGYTVEPVQTNMVYVQVGEQAGALKSFCGERGIKLSAAPRLRMVTHLDIASADIDQVVTAFADFRSS